MKLPIGIHLDQETQGLRASCQHFAWVSWAVSVKLWQKVKMLFRNFPPNFSFSVYSKHRFVFPVRAPCPYPLVLPIFQSTGFPPHPPQRPPQHPSLLLPALCAFSSHGVRYLLDKIPHYPLFGLLPCLHPGPP